MTNSKKNFNLDEYSTAVALSILENISHARTYPSIQKLNNEDWHKIAEELLVIELHIGDRFMFQWHGPKTRNEIMDKIIIDIASFLDSEKEEIPLPFLDYLKTVYNVSMLDSVFYKYNQRQVEYSKYKLTKNSAEYFAGWLYWEFGKKAASLIGRENDLCFITEIISFTAAFTQGLIASKKKLDRYYGDNFLMRFQHFIDKVLKRQNIENI